MSVRFEAANSEGARRTSFFAGDTAFAHGFWLYVVSLPPSGSRDIVAVYDGGNFQGWALRITSAGLLELYSYQQDAVIDTGATTLSAGAWRYVWMRRAGTGFGSPVLVYLDGSTTAEIDGGNFAHLAGASELSYARNPGFGGARFADIRILNPKWWSADLAASNATAEMAGPGHQSAPNAYSEYLLNDHTTDLADEGPGARPLTAVGTLSTEANPAGWSAGGGTPQELDGAGIVDFAGAAELQVGKPLGAAGVVEFAGAGALQAAKPLAGAGAVEFSGAGELQAAKPLDAAGAVTFEGSAELSVGTGAELDAAGAVTFSGSAELRVEKRLAAAGAVEMSGLALLEVVRGLYAAGAVDFVGAAQLQVAKRLDGQGTVLFDGTAELQVGAVVVLEILDLSLVFTRTIDRDLDFSRTLDKDLAFSRELARTLEF